jgi:roadblock/LC7 domain-containing protein
LRQKLIDGTAADESLLEGSGFITPSGWSTDGRFIAYTHSGAFPRTSDVWVLPLFGDRKPFPLAQTEFIETSGVFSPDGRWIAYTSNESGQSNVYVQPFLRAGGKHQVSREGGTHPVWRADGKELFYRGAGGTLMAVPIDATDQFDAGVPQALFLTGAPSFTGSQVYDVTKDGKRFLVNARPQQSGVPPLTVVVNWTAAIQK